MNTQQVLARYTPEWKKEVDDFQAECDARGLTIAHDVTEDVMRTIELGDYDSARNLLQGILDLF